MDSAKTMPSGATRQIRDQCGVLTVQDAVGWLGRKAVRWRLESGRWQRAGRGVVVTHSGPLTADQALWAAVLGCGPGAVLAGLTAAGLAGLAGFPDRRIHVLIPSSRRVHHQVPGAVVHRSRILGPADIHPARRLPQTRLARSLLDAAAWMGSGDAARAVLAAGVQQGLVHVDDLRAALTRLPRLPRRHLIAVMLTDIAGGAEALSELDFCRLTRRYRLPEPERQVIRRDSAGRRRWLDAYWDYALLLAEIDGSWHMEARAWWADMRRDNELTVNGYRVLRFPAFAVREHPGEVARQIAAALRQAGHGHREHCGGASH
jgi:hypothetical protein